MKCEKCKQDLRDSRRVSELKKEVFKIRLIAQQIANAETIEAKDEIVRQNLSVLQLAEMGGE